MTCYILWGCLKTDIDSKSEPQWMEPWRHMVVIACVCLCVCISFACISLQRLKLSAKNCNASVTWQYLWSLFCKFKINALLCSYGVICSPWHLLRAFQSQVKTNLSTADCFSTRQLCLCHRPGSNMSETRKQDSWMLATICPFAV